jgi:hypothetical protein
MLLLCGKWEGGRSLWLSSSGKSDGEMGKKALLDMAFGFSVGVHLSLSELFLCWLRVERRREWRLPLDLASRESREPAGSFIFVVKQADAQVVVKTSEFRA